MHRALPRSTASRILVTLLLATWATAARAETVRILPPDKRPDDRRLAPLVDLNQYFPFVPPKTPDEWDRRAERVRRQALVATGLWPMPTKTPDHAVIHGRVDRDGFTVERVFFESFPGHFVTGNLYRPKGKSGKLPGVLCPHGHWANGRFYDLGEKEIGWALVRGQERFDPAGRFPLQARCVQLARMGCVVFHYDMVGYADSRQLEHRPGFRPAMNTPENWGYFSPQAELRLENMMGLQTYNSIRTLDWFSELPDVDPKRIAVTGASGGGTQTFMLSALDPRPAVAFPAVMVSTAMQGGCTCENACYLRVGTGNIELAGLIAPRPLGMTAADDWTKEIAAKGLPELKSLYKMLGVEDLVMATPLLQFPHNYNYVSRAVMYHWLNRHLKLGFTEPVVEGDFKPLSIAEMTVWDAQHPKPSGDDDYERSLVRWITEDSEKQMAAAAPRDAASLAEYRRVVGGAVDVMIGRELPPPGTIECIARQERELGPWRLATFLLRNTPEHEEVPAVMLQPKEPGDRTAIWIDSRGKQALFDEQGKPIPAVERLLSAGVSVLGLDLFGQGEFTADGKPIAKSRLNRSGSDAWAEYAGYTFGYNHPVFSERVHDILAAVSFVKNANGGKAKVYVVGLAGAGHWVAAARAQAGAAVDRAAIDTAGFRFANVGAIDDPDFLPGGAKYLDLPGMIALSAGQPTWLAGEKDVPDVIRAAYQAAGNPDRLTVFGGDKPVDAAVEWLLR
ncbi:MAG: acetylxylan esterase [Planctomycetia bacterium]|nr:acetylxylan esterase [Planctomycetia bacterium]